jgi:hypothetical protein
MEVHRKYNLRIKKSTDNTTKKTFDNSTEKTSDTFIKKIPEIPPKKRTKVPSIKTSTIVSKTTQIDIPSTSQPKYTSQKEFGEKKYVPSPNKSQTSFKFENELSKLKIPIPLMELMNKNSYTSQLIKDPNIEEGTNIVNIVDDQPKLLFAPEVNGQLENGIVPPFYIILNIHDKTMHNVVLESSASHNLMPKDVMEKLGLHITIQYKYLYYFDSSKVKCIGLIKDLCVTLAQIPTKSLVMDIVVVDIPSKYGMLLSHSWGDKLQGTLQMDMSYATIALFGKHRRLYRETLMQCMVSSQHKPHNYPLYFVHSDHDSFILYNDGYIIKQISNL